jgi:hypothetical protein
MKAMLAVALAVGVVAAVQACNPRGSQCDALSVKSSPRLVYAGAGDTLWSKESNAPPQPQALRRGEIPVQPAAWAKDTIPKPHLVCVTFYKDTLPKP